MDSGQVTIDKAWRGMRSVPGAVATGWQGVPESTASVVTRSLPLPVPTSSPNGRWRN